MPVGAGEMMLGYIHNGTIRAEFMASMMLLHTSPAAGLIGRTAAIASGTLLSYGRNRLAEQFLDSPCQWLFMIDTDTAFTPIHVAQLAGHADPVDRPVVTGVVAILDDAGTGALPSLFTAVRDTAGTVEKFHPLQDVPSVGLQQVDACGAAFIMIHRSVLEKMSPGEWFREGVTPSGGIRGEDLAFCVRATDAGFTIWASFGVRPGHMKTVCITVD